MSDAIAEVADTEDPVATLKTVIRAGGFDDACIVWADKRVLAPVPFPEGYDGTQRPWYLQAAKEIKQLIGESVGQVAWGSQPVSQAGQTMAEILSSVQRVSAIVEEISYAGQEQSKGIAEMGSAITQMDQGTQQNAALVEQASAASQSLRQQATALADAVASFKLQEAPAQGLQRREIVEIASCL